MFLGYKISLLCNFSVNSIKSEFKNPIGIFFSFFGTEPNKLHFQILEKKNQDISEKEKSRGAICPVKHQK